MIAASGRGISPAALEALVTAIRPGGAKPRHRFEQKAAHAGFRDLPPARHADLLRYAREALALVWPEKAYCFEQIIVCERRVEDVAAELEVDERTVRRHLAGHAGNLGAEDWFLIILEMFREADVVRPNGADVVHRCLVTAHSEGTATPGPFHRALFWRLLDALAGSDLVEITRTLPWESPSASPALAWPCYRIDPPLDRSLLPGLVAAMRATGSDGNLLRFCLMTVLIAGPQPDESWFRLLTVFNTGGPRAVAERGGIPPARLSEAAVGASLLLRTEPTTRRFGILAMLACSSIEWTELCGSAPDPHLRLVPASERLAYCTRRYLEDG